MAELKRIQSPTNPTGCLVPQTKPSKRDSNQTQPKNVVDET